MYVVTFYSYKGGVGRTMGLVNVAAELARRGRKILIVDFDLEAPGITSYAFCPKAGKTLGVVDYVLTYLQTSIAPPITDYVSECSLEIDGEQRNIWIMPAGLQDNSYKSRFQSINWESLYSEQSGYLLLENLKAQWESLTPDYVFIDSRTGHTDVSGICTRQLPDADVFTFVPNRQNLIGLKQVVEEVRSEATGPRKKEIHLHFLASNIPDVDDEHGILEKNLAEFKSELGYEECSYIKHYDSLDLVDQVIFTVTHRKTRLAAEYVKVAEAIIKENPADPQGVLAYLNDLQGSDERLTKALSDKLINIEKLHANNSEILLALADVYVHFGNTPVAVSYNEQAIMQGANTAIAFKNLGVLYLQVNKKDEAVSAFKDAMKAPEVADQDVVSLARAIIVLEENSAEEILALPRVATLTARDKDRILDTLWANERLLHVASRFATSTAADPSLNRQEKDQFESTLPLLDISLGRYQEAMDRIGERSGVCRSSDIRQPFNFAMAEWGASGKAPADLFGRVVELARQQPEADRDNSANFLQCLALAYWGAGRHDDAKDWLDKARIRLNTVRDNTFSCWRYMYVRDREFHHDLDKMSKLFDGEEILPEFIQRNISSKNGNTKH